ncbi:MAG: hypothetical protein GEV12_19845 [Micromonosporaceae bacterium]|nr:hypothetical protein [Micromonosporaceae bacterium]
MELRRKGGPAIDTHTLFEIKELFRFRWDPAILACLAEQPWRNRALARHLGERIGDRVENNTLSRSLDRLRDRGFAVVHHTTMGRRAIPIYHITDSGRIQLDVYRALVRTYVQHPAASRSDNGTEVHALVKIADLLRFRWDPAILACLAEQPWRNRALAKHLGEHIGDRVEDNALSRSLGRLRRGGFVVAHPATVGRRIVPVYRITGQGSVRLDMYRAFVRTYQQHRAKTASRKPANRRPGTPRMAVPTECQSMIVSGSGSRPEVPTIRMPHGLEGK